MATEKHNIRLSKSLSWLLRHHLDLAIDVMVGGPEAGEDARMTGYVDVEAVLKLPRFSGIPSTLMLKAIVNSERYSRPFVTGYNEQQVRQVVELNDKQRFALRKNSQTGKLQIRANQGHTIKVRQSFSFVQLTPVPSPSKREKDLATLKNRCIM